MFKFTATADSTDKRVQAARLDAHNRVEAVQLRDPSFSSSGLDENDNR